MPPAAYFFSPFPTCLNRRVSPLSVLRTRRFPGSSSIDHLPTAPRMARAQDVEPSVSPMKPSPLGFRVKLQAEVSSRSVNFPASGESAEIAGLKWGMYVK
jgi:hypothetical protein